MKEILVSSLKGIEDVCVSEIKDILGVKARKVYDKKIIFKTTNIKKYLSKARTVKRVCYFIKKFKFKSREDILEKTGKIKFDFKGSFMVKCNREGNHDFKSNEIEKGVGGIILKKGYNVDVKNPKNIVFVDIADNICFVSYLIKDNLCRRNYRFRRNNDSIDACIAASLVKLGKIEKKHIVVNPLCKDAIIGIEVYLQGVRKVCCLDGSKNNIRNSKINTRLAKAKIEFRDLDVDWLDTLFKDKSVDRVIAIISYSLRKKDVARRDFVELINQAEYILKKQGKIIVVGRNLSMLKSILSIYNLKIEKEKNVFVGKEKYEIWVLRL
jgi:23S rRNA G2445 N2-methylase RlmL